MTTSSLKYFKLSENAKLELPTYEGDAGYDIRAVESKWIFPLIPRELNTGIVLCLPKGYYATIETRSKHGVKGTLRAHRGIIDSGFRGVITVKVYNHGFLPYKVVTGDKIAQLVLHKLNSLPLKEVFRIDKTKRGVRGYGSTG